MEIVATAPDGASASELIRAHEPDMAGLDINMPKLAGLEVLEILERDGLTTRVVFLTGTASDEQIATAVERGAWGLLLKEEALSTLIECLEAVSSSAGCRRRLSPQRLGVQPTRRIRSASARVDGARV